MVHSVQLIVGQNPTIASFLREWPVARAVELRGGWQAIPVNEALYAAIEARHRGAVRPSGLDVSPLGLSEAVAAPTAGCVGLAYVETEYFGGTGAQSSMGYVDGREVVAPQSGRGKHQSGAAADRRGADVGRGRVRCDRAWGAAIDGGL